MIAAYLSAAYLSIAYLWAITYLSATQLLRV
jgi:hypothetical protein